MVVTRQRTPPPARAPPPLLDLRRDLTYFARVGYIFSCYKAFQLKTRLGALCTGCDQAAIDASWARQHDWGGRELYSLAVDLKGFHLKGAQWLGCRPDICPPEWIVHLSKLQDRCPPLPLSEVHAILEGSLGTSMAAAFSTFEDAPIGSASIAQVHRARLPPAGLMRRRKPVAVKVQRPGAELLMLRDLRNVRSFFCLPFVRSSFAWDPGIVLDQVDAETKEEFDFEREARVMDAASRALRQPPPGRLSWLRRLALYRPPLRVPSSVGGMVTAEVLVMELLPGVPLSRFSETPQPSRRGSRWRRMARRIYRSAVAPARAAGE